LPAVDCSAAAAAAAERGLRGLDPASSVLTKSSAVQLPGDAAGQQQPWQQWASAYVTILMGTDYNKQQQKRLLMIRNHAHRLAAAAAADKLQPESASHRAACRPLHSTDTALTAQTAHLEPPHTLPHISPDDCRLTHTRSWHQHMCSYNGFTSTTMSGWFQVAQGCQEHGSPGTVSYIA
jgi:hypothetical protein